MNCWVEPLATVGFEGVTVIDDKAGTETVSVVLLVTTPRLALTMIVPIPVVVAKPKEVRVAEPVPLVWVQFTEEEISCVELSV